MGETVSMNGKNRPKQLLILAAPSCAGKSTLIEKIRNGQLPLSIEKQLQIKNLSTLPIFGQEDIEQIMFCRFNFNSSMILHYDLFCNYFNQDYHQSVLQIIEQFDSVTIITLFVPTKILLKRVQLRIIKTFIRICLKPSYFKSGFAYFAYQWNKHQKYLCSNIIDEIYQEWFDFSTAVWVSTHWILDSSQNQLKMQPVKVLSAK